MKKQKVADELAGAYEKASRQEIERAGRSAAFLALKGGKTKEEAEAASLLAMIELARGSCTFEIQKG